MTETDHKQSDLQVGVVLSSVSRHAGGVFDAVRQACGAIMEDPAVSINVHGVRDDRTDEDIADWAPVPVTAHDRSGPAALAYSPSLHKALKSDTDHHVFHQHGIWQSPSYSVLAWRKRTKRPVIISPHGMLDPWALSLSKRKKQAAAALFEQANLKGAACLHALNTSERDSIRAYGMTNPIAIIANGVSLPQPVSAPPEKLDEQGRRTLLFLGRIHPKKGLQELFEAWHQLKADAPEIAKSWRILAAGWDDGGHLEELKKLVVELGLENDVTFPGSLFGEDKAAAFRQASAFVLASHSEGLPMAILEAWAYRLPVFKTAACNLPVGFERDAAIEITTNPGEIFTALRDNLGRGDLAEVGERGFALASDQFTWTAIGAQFRALYRWVASGASADEKPDFVYL